MLDYPLAQWLAEPTFWMNHIHSEDREQAVAFCRTAVAQHKDHQFEYRALAADGHAVWLRDIVRVSVEPDGSVRRLRGLMVDITQRKEAEQREYIRNQVLERLAKGAPLPDILDALVRSVEASHSAALCSILLLDDKGRHLLLGAAPSLPEEYSRAIHGIAIGPGVGSCGTAAFRGERVIVSDIGSDPLWADHRELALSYGLQACWSQPILSGSGQVLGTFAIYRKEIHTPDNMELNTISAAANIACIAIEHVRAQQTLRIAATAFETQEGIMITDSNKTILRINQAFTRITGYGEKEVIGTISSILCSEYQDAKFHQAMWKKVRRDRFWSGEILDKRKSGEVFPAWLTISAVTAEDGSVTHYVGTFSDITEHRRTQDELQRHREHLQELVDERTANLRDSAARLQAVLDTVVDGIITIDERGIVETINPAAERIFGYAAAEVLGHNINMLMPEPYHSQHDDHLERYRAGGAAHITRASDTRINSYCKCIRLLI